MSKKHTLKKVTIVGLGIMGGSLGKEIIFQRLAYVTGVSSSPARIKEAVKLGAINRGTVNIREGVKDADLVVIAGKVMEIPVKFKQLYPYLKEGAIVTDVGSVKKYICEAIKKIDKKNVFVGSHPMVGSEKRGLLNSTKEFYKDGVCIMTPGKETDCDNFTAVYKFWKKMGMTVLAMTAGQHDAETALISHLPHLVAFCLVNNAAEIIKKNPLVIGPGFKGATRIAGSHEEVWAEIFTANKEELLKALSKYRKELSKLEAAVKSTTPAQMKKIMRGARLLREKI